ncbi:DUF945 family protein [Vibrio zhugei]|uniref:DUF945 family protein n=1 Tax=Vibrio zhugei TaxID=2479546 RepID=A0ABV7CCS2_9VIBR|nr:DUF945 family protein [Vibrio zhugei]
MNNVKKVGAIAGAIAIAACWPLAVGQIGQNVLEKGIKNIHSPDVDVSLVKYDRGYLSSDMTSRVTITDSKLARQFKADGLPTTFLVHSDIDHELFSLSSNTTLPDYPNFPFTLDTQTQLNGNTNFKLNIEKWNYQHDGKDAYSISTSAGNVTGMITKLGELSFKSTLPSVAVDFSNDAKITIHDIAIEGSGKRSGSLWVGDQTLTVGRINAVGNSANPPKPNAGAQSMQQAEPISATIEGLTYEFSSRLDQKETRFTSQHKITIDEFKSDDFDAHDLTLGAALNNVDRASFVQLSDLYNGRSNVTGQDLGQALPFIDTLFAKGFSVEISQLDGNIDDGDFTSQLKISMPEGTEHVTRNPAQVMQLLQGNLGVTLSESLAKQFPMLQRTADELVVSEIAKQGKDGYTMKATIEKGNLVFDKDHKIPLQVLMMMSMGLLQYAH